MELVDSIAIVGRDNHDVVDTSPNGIFGLRATMIFEYDIFVGEVDFGIGIGKRIDVRLEAIDRGVWQELETRIGCLDFEVVHDTKF